MTFDLARQIADAVLYEGYVLYPYRASSGKNQARFQFGVLVPEAYAVTGGESAAMQTECLVEPDAGAVCIEVRVRCLQLLSRTLVQPPPVDRPPTWDEGLERVMDLPSLDLADLSRTARSFDFSFPGGREVQEQSAEGGGTVVVAREWWPVEARIDVAAASVGRSVRLRVRIENVTDWFVPLAAPPPSRDLALRRSLVGVHTFIRVANGAFVSLLEPPAWAAEPAASCVNSGTWPVLVGDPGRRDIMLSSPIILYDYPAVAPESPGDFCDGTEIDELLALRVMTLTDSEKREARATDARAREILERADSLPPEMLERLHGTMRYVQNTDRGHRESSPGGSPPEPEALEADPGAGTIDVGGTPVSRGSRVRIRPKRRADSMDLFLAGLAATVQGVYHDADDRTWVALTVEDDPAADLHAWYGRFLYFAPDEIEPLGEAVPPSDAGGRDACAPGKEQGRKVEP